MPDLEIPVVRYAARSGVRQVDGKTELGLATASPEAFLDAYVERADVLCAALLRVADVAVTRFHEYLTAAQLAAVMDPIITTGDGVLRFESLSACCGVAARLDVLPGGLEATVEQAGTTNVDLGLEMRRLLAGVGGRDPLRLVAGEHGLEAHTLSGQAHERPVALPERWVRSLSELQVIASGMTLRAELDPRQARAFLTELPVRTAHRETCWVQQVPRGLRLGASQTSGAFPIGGPERLKPLAALLRHASALRVYAAELVDEGGRAGTASSWWELVLPHGRFGLALSPYTARGFSGEGAGLGDLARQTPQASLAAQGQLGYDLAEGRFFSRTLPFVVDVLEANPRLDRARGLVSTGRVRVDGDRVLVVGSRGEYAVRLTSDGSPDGCTCPWFGQHRGSRGPCAHALAARMHVDGSARDDR